MIQTKIVSAMEKCFIDQKPNEFIEVKKIRMYKNERASFQAIVYDDAPYRVTGFLKISIESELSSHTTLRGVESIPNYSSFIDEERKNKLGFLRTAAGLYPDVLAPLMRENCVPHYNGQLHSVMIDIEGNLSKGKYPLKVVFKNMNDEEVASHEIEIEVMDAFLPEQETRVTNWFYADCLADYYNIEVFSDKHFEICENFIRTAVRNGINMIMLPVFTPPLDTYESGERTTTQLVDICANDGKYTFDFSKVDRWIDMCDRCGVKYIEVCQLFTQWGAYHAPKIMAYVDGEYKKIFGWETAAQSDEYVSFLRQFLKEFTSHLEKRGDKDRTYFHLSDEPNEKHIEQYKTNKQNIMDLLQGWKHIEALSHVEYYKEGLVEIPVPITNAVEAFMKEDISERWVYYCCGPIETTNRGFAIPTPRTRSLGFQMYKYGIDGFLHWGYNFYNNELSYNKINPFLNPCGGYFNMELGGDCHLVYPSQDGTALESLRLMATKMAYDDIRLFKLCESFYGKDFVVEQIEDIIGTIDFYNCVNDVETMQKVRDRIDDLIAAKL